MATAPVAFLAPTATYIAYGNNHWLGTGPAAEATHGSLLEFGADQPVPQSRPEFGVSTYDVHTDGSGVCYSSRLRPRSTSRPNTPVELQRRPVPDRLARARSGQAFDVITDEDLHAEGQALLEPLSRRHHRRASGVHVDADVGRAEGYCDNGGRLMYLGGNGFYWRIALPSPMHGVIEVRRAEDGTRAWVAEPGEYYMSFTGEYGGMWRRARAAAQRARRRRLRARRASTSAPTTGARAASHDPRAAFIFEGVGDDERIGDFGTAAEERRARRSTPSIPGWARRRTPWCWPLGGPLQRT